MGRASDLAKLPQLGRLASHSHRAVARIGRRRLVSCRHATPGGAVFRTNDREMPAAALQSSLSPSDFARNIDRMAKSSARAPAHRLHFSHVTLRFDIGRADAGGITAKALSSRRRHRLVAFCEENLEGRASKRESSWLRGMLSALGQRRNGDEKKFFVKFDSWHTINLPLIRRAFPDVPWIFLYRDPLEVMVSQLRQGALNTVPGFIDLESAGIG